MKQKLAYTEPVVTVLGKVERLTGWGPIGRTFDNNFTSHRRVN
ncbi:hypothetical protein GCM10027168_09920 [Streptomyces capparidis]